MCFDARCSALRVFCIDIETSSLEGPAVIERSNGLIPIYARADPDEAIDLVFVPDPDYGFQNGPFVNSVTRGASAIPGYQRRPKKTGHGRRDR